MSGLGRWPARLEPIWKRWVRVGWVWALVFLAHFAQLAQAGTLALDPGRFDPAGSGPTERLTPAQRAAAVALGEAGRFVESGRFAEAGVALDRAKNEAVLGGYVELVQARLLLEQGDPAAAQRVATRALEGASSGALRAALGVLQGEALAAAGDAGGAELAWSRVLQMPEVDDRAVRQSVELAIVSSRQRTGSLDATADPLVLLDRSDGQVLASVTEVPIEQLSPRELLDKAKAALDRGHPARARELYERAIALPVDPSLLPRARLGRAHALFRERKYAGAVTAFGSLLPDLEARFWRARSLARNAQIDESILEFEEVSRGADENLASWALYLKGTLHEDRGEMEQAISAFRRAARFVRFPERARTALWREGWAQYRIARFGEARTAFRALAEQTSDPEERLRPLYWSARAARGAGRTEEAKRELARIARDFPLSYYGWRAQERLDLDASGLMAGGFALEEGTRQVDDEVIERAAMLVEAGLDDLARDELRFAARRARGWVDRAQVGILLARVGDYHRASQLVVTAYEAALARGLQPGREALWWLSWPPAYHDTIVRSVPEPASIGPELVWAIMREESHYRVDARSAVGAIGLLQLMPTTAAELAREKGLRDFETEDLFDPATNILLGTTYLDQLAARFGGRMSAAIGSYNAGADRVASWLAGPGGELEDDVWVENIPFDQTRAYVKRVLRSLHVYRRFYR